jgi:hypothetical protein
MVEGLGILRALGASGCVTITTHSLVLRRNNSENLNSSDISDHDVAGKKGAT